MKKIEIDIDVHRLIENSRESFDESENDILRRLLGIDPTTVDVSAEMSYSVSLPPMQPEPDYPSLSLSEKIAAFQAKTIAERLYKQRPATTRDWIYGGARLPEGSKLQKWSGKHRYEAVIYNGSILIDGVAHQSPSAAAMAINGGINVNGWTFWEYFDEKTQRWEKLSQLRKPYTG